MARKKSKASIAAVIVIALVIIGVMVWYFAFREDTDSLGSVDLDKYTLVAVDADETYYVGEPGPSGTMIFRDDEGNEKKVSLSEAKVEGFSTEDVGDRTMTVSVGDQSKKVAYKVIYKEIRYDENRPVIVSVGDPSVELDGILLECTGYNDRVVKYLPLSDFVKASEFETDSVGGTRYMDAEYEGQTFSFSYEVGYIGYGYTYEGKAKQSFGGYDYDLYSFVMNADGSYDDEGDGSLIIRYREEDFSDYPDETEVSFTWEKEYLYDDRLTITFSDGSMATYYFEEHELVFDADIFGTRMAFRLQMRQGAAFGK